MAMFGYMTDTETVEPIDTIEVESEGKTAVNIDFDPLEGAQRFEEINRCLQTDCFVGWFIPCL